MLKIAFTSCMLEQRFKSQPVWTRIHAEKIEHLVLLGDSIYTDINAGQRKLGDNEFAQRLFERYSAQLNVPEFKQLIIDMSSPDKPRIHATWDDHDFLWDNSAGSALYSQPPHSGKVVLSHAFMREFRNALVNPGAFPGVYNDARFWEGVAPASIEQTVKLRDGVWLHVTDGRTHRTEYSLVSKGRRAILGSAQVDALAQRISDSDEADIHLIAMGSTSKDWEQYQVEWNRLNDIASRRRVLMLSGDVHKNIFREHAAGAGFKRFEATSSGAAIERIVAFGRDIENFGTVSVGDKYVIVELHAIEGEPVRHFIDIERWREVPEDEARHA